MVRGVNAECQSSCALDRDRLYLRMWECTGSSVSSYLVPCCNKSDSAGSSLVVQWVRLCASNAEGVGLISDWGTKILHALWCSQKTKTKKQKIFKLIV